MARAPKIKGDISQTLERLRALDPAERGSAELLMDIVIALDEHEVGADEAAAIYAEVDRITRAINRRHISRGDRKQH